MAAHKKLTKFLKQNGDVDCPAAGTIALVSTAMLLPESFPHCPVLHSTPSGIALPCGTSEVDDMP
jgi:hypothetical protein